MDNYNNGFKTRETFLFWLDVKNQSQEACDTILTSKDFDDLVMQLQDKKIKLLDIDYDNPQIDHDEITECIKREIAEH